MKASFFPSKTRKGIEVSVLLDGDMVYSRWIPWPAHVLAGDSHRFPLFFPWGRFGEDVQSCMRRGYVLKPVRGVFSVGVDLFSPLEGGDRVRLTLPAGVVARVDGREMQAGDSPVQMELAFPFSGEIHGAPGWKLRFSGIDAPAVFVAPRFRPGFFAQALLWGVIALSGVLGAAFLEPHPPLWEEWEPPVRSRLAVVQWVPQRARKPEPPETVEEVPVRERLIQLRAAKVARVRRDLHPRPVPAAARLRLAASASAVKMPHEEHVLDLTDSGDSPGQEEPTLDLENAGGITGPVVTPVVAPVAPPPMPPPMVAAPAEKPKEAKPPRRISFPHVAYPESARHLGVEGKVRLLLHIDELGRVTKVDVVDSLHPLLDQAAVQAARQALYEPAQDARGNPVPSTASITVRFELEEE